MNNRASIKSLLHWTCGCEGQWRSIKGQQTQPRVNNMKTLSLRVLVVGVAFSSLTLLTTGCKENKANAEIPIFSESTPAYAQSASAVPVSSAPEAAPARPAAMAFAPPAFGRRRNRARAKRGAAIARQRLGRSARRGRECRGRPGAIHQRATHRNSQRGQRFTRLGGSHQNARIGN